jgi:hypothetical protein
MLYCTSQMLSAQPWDRTQASVGRPKLLYTPNCDYTKILDFSLVLNTLLNQLSSKCILSLHLLFSGNLQ